MHTGLLLSRRLDELHRIGFVQCGLRVLCGCDLGNQQPVPDWVLLPRRSVDGDELQCRVCGCEMNAKFVFALFVDLCI
jgi:hypothetical protein